MIDIEQQYKTRESVGLYLTSSTLLTDTYSVLKPTGMSMDEPSALSKMSFEQLVSVIATEKNREAFQIIFEHFAPRLKSYLLNFKIPDQKAEDLTQEVMLTLWQKAKKFDPGKAKLSTWLFRVARNKYIDQVRKQKYPELNVDDHMSAMVAPEKTDHNLEEKQNSALVKKAIAKLNDEQKNVIELSFFKELSHSQIAQATGLPLGTVKTRIRTAFKTLRIELGEHR